MFALMLPVALEIEADVAQAQFGAFAAAVAGLFGKGPTETFLKGIENIKTQVRQAQYRVRGQVAPGTTPATAAGDTADAFMKMMGKLTRTKNKPRKRYKAGDGDAPGKGRR